MTNHNTLLPIETQIEVANARLLPQAYGVDDDTLEVAASYSPKSTSMRMG